MVSFVNNETSTKTLPLGSETNLIPFDDGHTPEIFRNDSSSRSQIKVDPKKESKQQCLSVFPEVLPPHLNEEIYNITKNNKNGRSWGAYVLLEDAVKFARHSNPRHTKGFCSLAISSDEEKYRSDIATKAVFHFLLDKAKSHVRPFMKDILKNKIHGVAVWALSSDVDERVEYHVDYAELLRYEYNIICPPMYAGTIQCSPFNKKQNDPENQNPIGTMEGGDFAVNIQGLKHYEMHGYKGKTSQDPFGGYEHKKSCMFSRSQLSSQSSQVCIDMHSYYNTQNKCNNKRKSLDDFWITVPYQQNQGIFHTGEYPHLSTPITKINPSDQNHQRVIMGFNVFGFDVGPLIQEAPEHSLQFQRKVKRIRALSHTSEMIIQNLISKSRDNLEEKKQGKEGLHLPLMWNKLRNNKPLMKLLVLAKREKVKRAYQMEKKETLCELVKIIKKRKEVNISYLMKNLSFRQNGKTPRENDVLVYIHNWIKSGDLGKLGISVHCTKDSMWGFDGMISPCCILAVN